jgi:nucleoside-diphosphate-sugar epimerase
MTAEKRTLIVIGGGGMIGLRVSREALARGHNVTVIARDPSKIDTAHEHLSIVEGDVLDPGSRRSPGGQRCGRERGRHGTGRSTGLHPLPSRS